MTNHYIPPTLIVNTLRSMLKYQCSMSFMSREALAYIRENGLLKITRWPAYVIQLSDTGIEFIRENAEGDDEQ